MDKKDDSSKLEGLVEYDEAYVAKVTEAGKK